MHGAALPSRARPRAANALGMTRHGTRKDVALTAQIWLLTVLSGLGIGMVGWSIRGWQASGRELMLKRKFETLLCAVEMDATRTLAQTREHDAEDRRRLMAERDALQARLLELEPTGAGVLNLWSGDANGAGAPVAGAAISKRPNGRLARNANGSPK